MSLITLLIVVIICGLMLWLVGMLPIAEPFKTIAYVVVAVMCIVYLLHALSGLGGLGALKL